MSYPKSTNPTLTVGSDGVGWILFDDPHRDVNILTRAVMEDFAQCLDEARRLGESGSLKAVVLWSGKDATFLAGADVGDIEDLTDPARGEEGCRLGQEIFQGLEDLPLPTLAAIHGVCLGGGLEMALACTRRIASDGEETRLGSPEILLGILPAWGGTTRLPRLIGLKEASRMILSGKRYSAPHALAVGLVDEVLPAPNFKALILECAHRMVMEPSHVKPQGRRTHWLLDRTSLGRRFFLGMARRKVVARTEGHYPGPERVLDVLGASGKLSLREALALEAQVAGKLIASPVSKNLIHLFRLREDARKGRGISEKTLNVQRYTIRVPSTETGEEGMVHRIMESYLNEARVLHTEGFGTRRIDAAARAFGLAKGPFDLMTGKRSRKAPRGEPDPEMRDRMILSMVTEASAIMEEGRVPRAGGLDLALIMANGFPPFRGGLLRYADQFGLPAVVAWSRDFTHRFGSRFTPSPLLLDLAQKGETFYSRFP